MDDVEFQDRATAPLLFVAAYAAMAAGVLSVVADLQHLAPGFQDPGMAFSENVDSPFWLVHGVTHILATTLLLAALPGLFFLHAGRFGSFGRVAFAASFLFVSAYLGVAYVMTFATPDMPAEVIDEPATGALAVAFAAYPLSALSLLAAGVAMTRARVLPFWSTLTFAFGAILTPASDVLSAAVSLPVTGASVLGIGLAWMGLGLLQSLQGTQQPAPPVPLSSTR